MDCDNDFIEKLNNGGWSLLDEAPINLGDEFIKTNALPYINDTAAWDQFNNEVLYDADKRIRAWIDEMREDRHWVRDRSSRKYTFSMLFKILFGRSYDCRQDTKHVYILSKLFSYYSTQVNSNYYNKKTGKTRSKTCYCISSQGTERPPYSLKLRLEWLESQGILPSARNMKMPKDDLSAGHARNPKTDANIQKRRELARERYREYQQRRNEDLKKIHEQ